MFGKFMQSYLFNEWSFYFRILVFRISVARSCSVNRLIYITCKKKKKPDIRNANINEYKRFVETDTIKMWRSFVENANHCDNTRIQHRLMLFEICCVICCVLPELQIRIRGRIENRVSETCFRFDLPHKRTS